jgi:hypothetical protein
MIPGNEVKNKDGALEFTPLAFRGTGPQVRVALPSKPIALVAVRPYQLNLTGSQLLVAASYVICLACLAVWLVRYWLFVK